MSRAQRALSVAALATFLAVWPSRGAAAGPEPVLKSGDRVVFYGDSITEQRLYTRYVRQYVAVRHPEWDVRFWNAGWGGDTAAGGLQRLERDVLSLSPTMVTLYFGMNDGGYAAPDEKVVAAYRASLASIVKALTERGVRVVVFTPGCVDYDRNPGLGVAKYDETLEALGKAALSVAKEHKARGFDVFHPMLAFQAERKKADPSFVMIPDGVHPSPAGHLVVANLMLEGLGLEPMAPMGRIDVASGTGEGLRVAKTSPAETVLETTAPLATPFWFDPASQPVMETSGFLDARAGQRLTISGLATGDWELSVDGALAGRFTSASLSRGVAVGGTWSAAGKDVHDLVSLQENAYFDAWRNVRLPLDGRPGLPRLLEGLATVDEAYGAMVRARAAATTGVSISLVRAPSGENLALRKAYASSDPNTFGWGAAGLTDGSWEGSAAHCFATGAAPQFPKSVTIDLEKIVKVAAVRLGVPDFGSTKTVVVSVSGDGKRFHEVGKVEFALRKADRRTVAFEPKNARFVRLTYADHHAEQAGYPDTFAFTTEAEVYGPN